MEWRGRPSTPPEHRRYMTKIAYAYAPIDNLFEMITQLQRSNGCAAPRVSEFIDEYYATAYGCLRMRFYIKSTDASPAPAPPILSWLPAAQLLQLVHPRSIWCNVSENSTPLDRMLLEATGGVRVSRAVRRLTYNIGDVRICLDHVDEMGDYVLISFPVASADEHKAHDRANTVFEMLGIDDKQRYVGWYGALSKYAPLTINGST